MPLSSRDNVKTEVKGDKLIITIDLKGGGEVSRGGAGKSIMIASTGGNRPIALSDGSQVSLGVNCYKPKT